MDVMWKASIWQQFGATIDMLDNALRICPDELWHECLWHNPNERPTFAEFWYITYHTLFWLDLYLSGAVEGFVPPAPFTLDELDPAGLPPDRSYTKDELRSYLAYCRRKCQVTIEALTDDTTFQRCHFSWGEVSFVELLLYNMRHVQEHAAQLSLFIGQRSGLAASWVTKAQSK